MIKLSIILIVDPILRTFSFSILLAANTFQASQLLLEALFIIIVLFLVLFKLFSLSLQLSLQICFLLSPSSGIFVGEFSFREIVGEILVVVKLLALAVELFGVIVSILEQRILQLLLQLTVEVVQKLLQLWDTFVFYSINLSIFACDTFIINNTVLCIVDFGCQCLYLSVQNFKFFIIFIDRKFLQNNLLHLFLKSLNEIFLLLDDGIVLLFF